MIALDYQKLADTPAVLEPFPHVVVPGFVPADSLRAVLTDLLIPSGFGASGLRRARPGP
jgi:hypothetical protein